MRGLEAAETTLDLAVERHHPQLVMACSFVDTIQTTSVALEAAADSRLAAQRC